jgi:hypothetical protein
MHIFVLIIAIRNPSTSRFRGANKVGKKKGIPVLLILNQPACSARAHFLCIKMSKPPALLYHSFMEMRRVVLSPSRPQNAVRLWTCAIVIVGIPYCFATGFFRGRKGTRNDKRERKREARRRRADGFRVTRQHSKYLLRRRVKK